MGFKKNGRMRFAEGFIAAGIDEAGRGPLAGPVVAAAVILDPKRRIRGLADSKVLAPERRQELAHKIRAHALDWAIGAADVEEIDRINILRASLLAMARAFAGLKLNADVALVDGNQPPTLSCKVHTIVGGDASEPAISAASILAKVHRDALMCELDDRYPQYGFALHKGYSTDTHMAALRRFGPCPCHRRSFAPVRIYQSELVFELT
jgi:ribonuclease HII